MVFSAKIALFAALAAATVSAVVADTPNGDSYTQSGFNISSTKPSASNPIGNPAFPGTTTAGGTNWLGYLVTEFNNSIVLNYNFAVGGSGINTTLVTTGGKPLPTQVSDFLSNLGSKPDYAPWTSKDSLFLFWIGINDIGNSYYLSVDQDALHAQMMNTIFSLVDQLYAVGARNFLFLNVPPVEKTPRQLLKSEEDRALEATQIADFNTKLFARATTLKESKPKTSVYKFDTQVPFNQVINNPTAYGYTNATTNCRSSTCMWWDTYHPSTGVHKLVAEQVADLIGPCYL